MRKSGNFCDYFVITSGNSTRQVRAIADNIKEGLQAKSAGPRFVEGDIESGWMVVDCFDIIVHIFHSPVREFYNLEKLWQDAPRVKLLTPKTKNVSKRGRKKSK